METLARLTKLVTAAPDTLRPSDRGALDDATLLHAVMLSSFFGYLNRVADAVGIELDYETRELPPVAAPEVPPWPRPAHAPRGTLSLALRPGAQELIDAWHTQLFERDAPLTRARRARIAAVVADATGEDVVIAPVTDRTDVALGHFADTLARAPWKLGAHTIESLRKVGLDDAQIFDAIASGAHQSFLSRMKVALANLGAAAFSAD